MTRDLNGNFGLERMKFMKLKNTVIQLLIICSLYGCGYESLYTQLDERQANEMLVLLLADKLAVKKTAVANGWTLETKLADLPRAMQVLKAHGFPRDDFQTLGEVFKKEGFVSSPLEEKARLLYGLSQELSNTISTIDGVIVARVHIAIPEKNVLSEDQAPSSASVFIKHRSESKIDTQLASIKALVVNSVEGLAYDNVTVTLFPSDVVLSAQSKIEPMPQQLDLSIFWLQESYLTAAAIGVSLFLMIVFLINRRFTAKSRHHIVTADSGKS